jgi:hypothetical protein
VLNVVHLEKAKCERSVLEIIFLCLKMYNSPRFSSFTEFLDSCFFLLNFESLLYTPCTLGLRTSALIIRMIYLQKIIIITTVVKTCL